MQQRITAADGGGLRRLNEGKGLDLAHAKRLHAQDDLREIRALDFRLRELRALQKILLAVKPHTYTGAHATGAASALVSAALRHGFDGQALGPRAWIVAAHAREAGINDDGDARDGQRGLRHIRRDDDAPLWPRREHPLLIRAGHATIERQHFKRWPQIPLNDIARVADVPLRRHEY